MITPTVLSDHVLLSSLTARERAFVQHPLALADVRQAGRDSGFSESTCNSGYIYVIARQLHSYVTHYSRQRLMAHEITVERITSELAAIAFVDPTQFYEAVDTEAETIKVLKDVTRLPESMRRAIKNINYTHLHTSSGGVLPGTGHFEIELHDKVAALKALAEYYGLRKGELGKGEPTSAAEAQLLENLTPEELEQLNAIYKTAANRTQAIASRKRDARAIEGK